jgi:hypothetical protein
MLEMGIAGLLALQSLSKMTVGACYCEGMASGVLQMLGKRGSDGTALPHRSELFLLRRHRCQCPCR